MLNVLTGPAFIGDSRGPPRDSRLRLNSAELSLSAELSSDVLCDEYKAAGTQL